ncbi:MAG: hypothetical protein ABEH65_11195 [Halobacteriales archaeon]
MTADDTDPMLYPNRDATTNTGGVSRRRLLAGSATVGAVASAGCVGSESEGNGAGQPTVFVFNTGDGTVSLIDPESQDRIETRSIGLSSSFPSNQYTPILTDDTEDSLWLNVGRGVRGIEVGSLSETTSIETGSGANWLEQTPDGAHVVVSAREPSHSQLRIDADTTSETFGEVTAEIDRTSEEGRGDNDGPGPCDVTIHPDGQYAYVPDIFGDTLTVLRIDPFEIVAQIDVEPAGNGPARPWMGTAAPDGQTLLVEHNEGDTGTESIWDISEPSAPEEIVRLTADAGLGRRPLTSEIGPDSDIGYVFTPGSNDVTVIDLAAETVVDRLDLGGSAFVGTWNPSQTHLFVPIQTNDEVAVIDHERLEIVNRIDVGDSPYGATAAQVRPRDDPASAAVLTLARLGITTNSVETTYCIGNCACGHEL